MKKTLSILIVVAILLTLTGCNINHKHTYGDYLAYESGHYHPYTCGCPQPEILEGHVDADTNGICDVCKYNMTIGGAFEFEYVATVEGHCEHKIGEACDGTCIKSPHEDLNHDMICDVCDYRIESQVPTNYFLRNQLGCEWLNEIKVDDISEIKIISEAVGVAPGTPKSIQSSTDNEVIERIFEDFYWLDTCPISKEDGQIDGGGAVTVKFILKDGTKKEIYINNGNYWDTNENCFELLYTPKFEESDNVEKTYGFITYIGTATIYDCDNNSICEIPVDELEYIITGYDFSLFNNGYDYFLDTEFGKLFFVKVDIFASEVLEETLVRTDYYFIVENDNEFCYRIVGKNIDDLIAEYSAEECNHQWDDGVEVEGGNGGYVMEYTCSLCGDKQRETITIIPPNGASYFVNYQSDRTKDLLIEGFAPTEANPGDTVVLRTYPLMDAELAFYANGVKLTQVYSDYDYWEYIFIMPDDDVVITHEITDGFLPD